MTTQQNARVGTNRRIFLFGATACTAGLVVSASTGRGLAAPALHREMGDFRRLKLTNWRTGESIDCVYYADGHYIGEAMRAFDHVLRDWRAEKTIEIDRNAIDILAAVQRKLECEEAFEVVSGYRSAATNAMLRRRSRGVARKSYHVQGMAVDVAMKTRSVRQISGAAMSVARGGVGKYSRAEFVHMDSGPVRDWGR